MAATNRKIIDPGAGIPPDPSSQLLLLTSTNNGWHNLDPDNQPSQEPFPFQEVSPKQLVTQSVQMQLLNLAKSFLGYSEDSRGRSRFGIWYGDQPDVQDSAFDTAPWCDMFLAWLTMQLFGWAGLRAIGDYALTTAHAAFLHAKGVTDRPDVLSPGAFAFQNWDRNGTGNANLYKIDHVEIVERDNGDGTATFIGGNVDNGVRRRRRSKAYLVVQAEWWKLFPVPRPRPTDEDFIDA